MSKAEEMIKTRLKKLMKAQASMIKSDRTINDNQKIEQLMVIEEVMNVLNREAIIDSMGIHEYTVKRIYKEEEIAENR